MRYRLRTLLILLAIGPPMLAGVWWGRAYNEKERRKWHGSFGQAVAQIALLNDAVNFYYLNIGRSPPDLLALLAPPNELTDSEKLKWSGPYLDKPVLPYDPWGNQYHYKLVNSAKHQFQIWSNGSDGITPSKDDIYIDAE